MPSPWVQRALRHEIMAQPRGAVMASRKYTGVTRNAEADLVGDAAEYAVDPADPTLDPAYPFAPDEDGPRDMAWSLLSALDAYDDVPEFDDPDVDTVALVMERARALALRVTAPETELPFDPAYYSDGSRV
jgi:hypothetical protein